MCGIIGAYRPVGGEACSDEVLTGMRDKMIHRGPDGGANWRSRDGKCVLGHRRLSIIDLAAAADQPMINQEGTVALVFNGEIYNHAELRKELESLGKYQWKTDHSDTEVLLHAYEEWGLDCVQRFYGMFAFVVYDNRDAERPVVHAVRDRIGIKPLYFARTARGEWLFGSEIRALVAHPDISLAMDRTAFWHYLTFIVTPAPMTLFRGIFKLPAGHSMTIDHRGKATASCYWDIKPDKSKTITEKDLSEEEAVAELTRLLRQSIKRRMVSDVPFGVLLSGGVDSSLNVALMSELMDRPVTTFTVGYEGKEDYNEFQFARAISKQYNTDHHEVMIDRAQMQEFLPLLVELQDEPIADNVCIPLYFLAKLVRDSGTTVVQVGEGADENFLGYWWCERYRNLAEKVYEPARRQQSGWWQRMRHRFSNAVPLAAADEREAYQRAQQGQELFWGGAACWWGDIREKLTPRYDPYQEELACPVEGLMPQGHSELDSHAVVEHYLGDLSGRLADPEVLQKIPYMELKLRLPEHLLMRVDKLTMAHSIEARVPFLDHDIVEFATRLSPSFKLKDGVGKHLLKRAAEPYLPHEMIHRRKQGFGAPMEEWFKEGTFGPRCLELFQRSRLAREGYFDNQFFTGMLKSQMNGGGGHSFHLWTVLNAVLWHERWIEGRHDCF